MIENIIAHRGIHDELIPENSLPSFKKALKKNIPIELDIHILSDGTVIVFHDDNLKRMTGYDKKVKDCTYEEIKKLFLKNTYEKIPTLEEVLNLVNGKVKIIIEYKSDVLDHSLEKASLKILENYKGEILLKSFSRSIFKYLKRHSKYKVGLLIGNIDNKTNSKLKKLIYKNINLNIFYKPDFISFDYHIINQKNIKNFKKTKFVWTIKSIHEYNNLKDKCDYQIVENII